MFGRYRIKPIHDVDLRRFPLGMDSKTSIPPGATAEIISRPQVIFRPDRLLIPPSIAANFMLLDFKIGKNSMLLSCDAIPAETFSDVCDKSPPGLEIKAETAQVSQDVLLRVQNTSQVPIRFYASLIGPSVE